MNPIHSLKILLPSLFTLLLLFLMGCGNHSHTHQQLLHAEDIMEEHPDSAYTILSSMKMDSTISEEDCALHVLLLTQAMDKIGIIDQTDVERLNFYGANMDKAISYFVRKKQNNLAMKSYYYKGVITFNKPDSFIYSLEPFSISLDYATEANDAFYIARNYNMMSEIYRRVKAYDDQAQAQQSALTYFSKTGKKQFIDYSRYSLSKALYNAGRHEEAVAKLDSLLTDLSDDETSALSVASMNLRARALYYSSLFKECANQIERIDSLGFHAPDLVLFYAASYIGMDSISRARRIMESMSEDLDSEDRNILDNLLYSKTASHPEEYESLSMLYYRLAEDYKDITKGNLNTVQNLVNRNADQRHHLERENLRLKQMLVIFLALILLSIMIFIILRVNRRRRNAEKELDEQYKNLQNAHTQLKNLLSDFQKKEAELRSISLEKEKMEEDINYILNHFGSEGEENSISILINALSGKIEKVWELNRKEIETIKRNTRDASLEYIRMISGIVSEICEKDRCSRGKKEKIAERVESLKDFLETFKANDSRFKLRERIIDILTDNAISKLRTGEDGMPKLREEYIIMTVYLFHGFEYDTIAMLFGRDKGSLYNLKRRLNDKLDSMKPEQKEIFKSVMDRKNSKKQ